APLRFVVEKALEKDPADRYQSMDELVVDLRRALRSTGSSTAPSMPTPRPGHARTRQGAWMGAVVLAIIALAVLTDRYLIGRPPAPAPGERATTMVRQQRLSDFVGLEEDPAVSPQGTYVAFVRSVNGRKQIWGYLLEEGELFPIATDDGVDHAQPRWSGDNELIYTVVGADDTQMLWKTAVPTSSNPRFIDLEVSGTVDVSQTGDTIAMVRLLEEGPAMVLIENFGENTETSTSWPLPAAREYDSVRWSPDDALIAIEARRDFAHTDIQVMDVDTGEITTVTSTGRTRGIAWRPDGSGLVYASSERSTLPYPPAFSLWTVDLDGSGKARLPLSDAGYASYVDPDITPDGALVASRVRMESDLYRYPVDGETPAENMDREKRITWQTGQVQVPSASPDGEEVAYLSDRGGHANVWIARVDGTEPPRQITFERDPSVVIAIPKWSPSGELIAYIRYPQGSVAAQWLVDPDGRTRRMLVESAVGAVWSADSQWLYYIHTDGIGSPEQWTEKAHVDGRPPVHVRSGAINLLITRDGRTGFFSPSNRRLGEIYKATPAETGTPMVLRNDLQARIPAWPHCFTLSPDDRWLAMPLRDRDTTNIWLISTEDGSEKQITDFGQRATLIARNVSWSGDSKYLFAAVVELDADIVKLDGVLP
ncbi:MAG: hypothetical protein ACYTGC_13215, partial [Planctomycetota bacterium]